MKKTEAIIEPFRLDAVKEELEASTGKIGDGQIPISPVEDVLRIHTGERGPHAL